MLTEKEIAEKLIADAAKMAKEGQDMLAALEKPELRHGDYGIEESRCDPVIIIKTCSGAWPDDKRPIALDKNGGWNYADTNYSRLKHKLGNIFDDMNSEPLTEFWGCYGDGTKKMKVKIYGSTAIEFSMGKEMFTTKIDESVRICQQLAQVNATVLRQVKENK